MLNSDFSCIILIYNDQLVVEWTPLLKLDFTYIIVEREKCGEV